MVKKETFELVVVIVNSGFSETVMAAAREAGARGGSITHCRGTSNTALEKKFGVFVTPEKEMILIVIPTELRDNILTSVYKAAGNDGTGKCVAFSLPVSSTVGIKSALEKIKK